VGWPKMRSCWRSKVALTPIGFFAAPKLELAQEVGSQVASSANLLVVDTEVVERLFAPAENELQNVVKLFQRKVVRSGGTSGADFQQYDPEVRRSQQDGVGMNLHYLYPTRDL
jgi:hypothetical protein